MSPCLCSICRIIRWEEESQFFSLYFRITFKLVSNIANGVTRFVVSISDVPRFYIVSSKEFMIHLMNKICALLGCYLEYFTDVSGNISVTSSGVKKSKYFNSCTF
jgi:hypothetical protein